MSAEPTWHVGIEIPQEWYQLDPEVLEDSDFLRALGFSTSDLMPAATVEDVVVMAVLSELIEDDDDNPIGALSASVVAMLAPPSLADQDFPIERREPFGGPVDGIQAMQHVVIYRAAFPQINCDLLMQFTTPNLPLLDDLIPLFERIAATATCEAVGE